MEFKHEVEFSKNYHKSCFDVTSNSLTFKLNCIFVSAIFRQKRLLPDEPGVHIRFQYKHLIKMTLEIFQLITTTFLIETLSVFTIHCVTIAE